ncbi:hypothetical protein TSAR_015870 [Trichomalopsis sarcophagae]|uniref:Uncharacterized protein n=1 Tax=Trichomalopsis sarcophagae TaxID=543379 RepID=A0A232EU85_9HYME|nr:hypothetical protein TSAR_015870 [Trichomalopsis sarcophagae]
MKANGTNNDQFIFMLESRSFKTSCSRLNTPLAATTTLEDPGTPASWKGPPPGSEASPFTSNSVNQGGGPNSGPYNSAGGPPSNSGGFQGPSPFPGGAGSPAGAPSYQGPPPGSATPQYTASPAPSGSSTPGPGPQPNAGGFPPPPNNSGPPYNGPSPFGSPSGGPGQFVGRPGSSGPPFVPPGGGNPHFPSPGQPFGGPQYGMPPGSPYGPGPGGHPMAGPMGPGHPAMMGPGGPVDRMDQGKSIGVTDLLKVFSRKRAQRNNFSKKISIEFLVLLNKPVFRRRAARLIRFCQGYTEEKNEGWGDKVERQSGRKLTVMALCCFMATNKNDLLAHYPPISLFRLPVQRI